MRRCKGCLADISERGPNAVRCAACQRNYRNRQARKKYRADRDARAAKNERNRAGHRRRSADPDYRAERAAAARERRRTDQDWAERQRANDRKRNKTPAYRARNAAEQRRRRARRRHARNRRPGHCAELSCWCWSHHREPRRWLKPDEFPVT